MCCMTQNTFLQKKIINTHTYKKIIYTYTVQQDTVYKITDRILLRNLSKSEQIIDCTRWALR